MPTFDVICAGNAFLDVAENGSSVRAGRGAITTALALASHELRVGLATVLEDDTLGRALRARVAASRVDVDGVTLAPLAPGLALVRGGARQVVSFKDERPPLAIPESWSSKVLLLSGMSPLVSHAAALCKAARAARRVGTIVVVDINARWDLWEGRDARPIRMVLREADVVWCSAQDRVGLNVDVTALRASMRPNAVLVSGDGMANASATGPFGEVRPFEKGSTGALPLGEDDVFTATICAELARVGHIDEMRADLWSRALERAHTIATARARG